MEGDAMEHPLGVVEGPCWLEATSALLNLAGAVDAVAETEVCLRRLPLAQFQRSLLAMPQPAQVILHDVALAHRQQTELAVSRVAKGAEAHCAEWLLHHTEPGSNGQKLVILQRHKRSLAAQLGIAPETLSRILRHLRHLQECGLVSGSGRRLSLLDPDGLKLLAGVRRASA
jgi:CRP/FNR family transcriptional regulator, dissimilatory nitrate respiration regulator